MNLLLDVIDAHFNALGTFQLALIGILVSSLSIIFAVMIGKRDEISSIENSLKEI